MRINKRQALLIVAIVGVSTTAIIGLSWASANHLLWCGGGIYDQPYVPQLSIEDLTRVADTILLGTVQRVGPSWTSREGPIVTNVDINVSEHVKPSQTNVTMLSLIAAGGTIGCWTETWSGEPRSAEGEGILVFLVPTPDGHWRVTQGIQGKFTVSDGTASRPIDAASVPLSDLLDEIRRNL